MWFLRSTRSSGEERLDSGLVLTLDWVLFGPLGTLWFEATVLNILQPFV